MQTLPETPLPFRLAILLLALGAAIASLVLARRVPGPRVVAAHRDARGALVLTIDRAADYPDGQPGGALVSGLTAHMTRNPALGWMWRGAGSSPHVVGWRIAVPRAGRYLLRVRYAAEDSRPMRVLVDGVERMTGMREVTGGRTIATWFDEGTLDLAAGLHRLVLRSDDLTPSIDVVELVQRAPGDR